MTPRHENGEPIQLTEVKSHLSGIPEWSYNLIDETVPLDRNCEDAKIPVEFCPCIEERSDLMPYYYVGHAEKLDEMEKTNFTFYEGEDIDDDKQYGDKDDDNTVDDDTSGHPPVPQDKKSILKPVIVPGFMRGEF